MRAILLKDERINNSIAIDAFLFCCKDENINEAVFFHDKEFFQSFRENVPNIKTTLFEIDWINKYPPYKEKVSEKGNYNCFAAHNLRDVILEYSDILIYFRNIDFSSVPLNKSHKLYSHALYIKYPIIVIDSSTSTWTKTYESNIIKG